MGKVLNNLFKGNSTDGAAHQSGIDLTTLLLFLGVIVFTILLTIVVRKVLNRFFKKSSTSLHTDPTRYRFLLHAIPSLVFIIGLSIATYTIPSLRAISVSIFAGAGVLAIMLGLASQQAFSNIISGLFIVIFKPFGVHDRLEVGKDYVGVVEDITLRHTIIRDFQNRRIVIPNSVISSEILVNANLNEEKVCRFLEVGISYEADIQKAIEILQEVALEHPDFYDNRSPEEKADKVHPVQIRVLGFGESAINLRAYIWAVDAGTAFKMFSDLYPEIKKRFDKANIEIPYPQRTISYKKGSKE